MVDDWDERMECLLIGSYIATATRDLTEAAHQIVQRPGNNRSKDLYRRIARNLDKAITMAEKCGMESRGYIPGEAYTVIHMNPEDPDLYTVVKDFQDELMKQAMASIKGREALERLWGLG